MRKPDPKKDLTMSYRSFHKSLCSAVLLTVTLISLAGAALAETPLQPVRDRDGKAFMLRLPVPETDGDEANRGGALPPEEVAKQTLDTYGSYFGIRDTSEFSPSKTISDEVGTSVRFQRRVGGIPVLNDEMIVHLDGQNRAKSINGSYETFTLEANRQESISLPDAQQVAKNTFKAEFGVDDADVSKVEEYIITPENQSGKAHSTYAVTAVSPMAGEDRTYFIDKASQEIVKVTNSARYMDRRVYNCSNTGSWSCPSQLYDANYDYTFGRREGITTPRGPNPDTQYGYDGMEDTDKMYDYLGAAHNYWNQYGLNGANNLGGTGNGGFMPFTRTGSYVLVDHLWGPCPDNASYIGNMGQFNFCARSGVAADVVGHEYFHAVVWFAFSPNGTEYTGHIGALEEASGDIFGEALEKEVSLSNPPSNDWHHFPQAADGRRRLSNPPSVIDDANNTPFPDRFGSSNVYCGSDDNGGIHHNSTIFSKAAYLMAEGGSFNGCNISGIGFQNVQDILHHAWVTYFERNTSFNQAVIAMHQACLDLFSVSNPASCDTVTAALQATELDQLGYCADPEGLQAYTPACAVPAVVPGVVEAARPTAVEEDLFSPNEHVWSLGSGWQGVTEVDVYVSQSTAVLVEGADIVSIEGSPVRVNLDPDGSFVTPLWTADRTGFFEIIVDGNLDGIYQSATDSSTSFEVRALVDGDGLCYAGEHWTTSEDCHNQPLDCGCSGQNVYCSNMLSDSVNRYRCLSLLPVGSPRKALQSNETVIGFGGGPVGP